MPASTNEIGCKVIENVIALVSFLAFFALIGIGPSRIIQKKENDESLSWKIFWAVSLGMLTVTLSSSLMFGLDLPVYFSWIPIVLVAIIFWIPRFSRSGVNPKASIRGTFGSVVIGLFITVVLVVIPASTIIKSGQPLRLGPDAIGNATASAAIARGEKLSEVRQKLYLTAPGVPKEDFFDAKEKKVYETPSIQTQIENEFLVAGLRWGLSATAGLLVNQLGIENLWLVLNGLGNLALVITALGLYILVRDVKLVRFSKAFIVISGSISPIILNGYREGGMAQAWAIPSSIALLVLISRGKLKSRSTTIFLGLFLAFSAVSYSDLFILQIGLVVALIILPTIRPRLGWKGWGTIAGVCFAAAFPFFLVFVSYIPRRFADASTGGWSMPYWTSMSESIGLLNRFTQSGVNGLEIRSPIGSTNAIFLDLLIVLLIVISYKKSIHDIRVLIGVLSLLLVGVVRVKTQYFDSVSNYQYFKAFGTLAPLIVLGIGILMFMKSENRSLNNARLFCAGLFTFLSIFSVVRYTTEFRETSTMLPNEMSTKTFVEEIKVLDRVNLFSRSSLQTAALAPYTGASWLGRGMFEKSENIETLRSHAIVVLIFEETCNNWKCLHNLDGSKIVFQTKFVVAYEVSDNSKFLSDENIDGAWNKQLIERYPKVMEDAGLGE
jgi:hypothetical protein